MALINLRDVRIAFGGPPVLDAVDLQIEAGERLCLVGRNGAGKSTLMKLIAGQIAPDSGAVSPQREVRIAYLDQDVPAELVGPATDLIAAGLQAGDAEDKNHARRLIDIAVARLDLDPRAEFATLSGGLQRRVLLARALVRQPDLLLLDEPTNHLDLDTITWVENFLLNFDGSLLFVSHDRALVHRLATRIVEIDRGQAINYTCDYATFLQRQESRLLEEEKRQVETTRKIAREEIWIRRSVTARRSRNEGRARALQEMRQERRQYRARTATAQMQLQEIERSGKLVIEAQNLHFAYGDQPIVGDFSTLITRGDKIGIIGPNGTGKTTLMRLLTGDLAPQQGTVRYGTRLQVVQLDQMRTQLDDARSVLENISDSDHITIAGKRRHVIGYLSDFLFSPDQVHSPVHMLSGGERNRLLLARLFARPANLLLMDEPTNDLDVETLELLEELLAQYSGTLLLISHDRTFLNNVVTSTLAFEGGGFIKEYIGGYDDYLRQRPSSKPQAKPTSAPKLCKPRQRAPRLSYKDRRELESLPNHIEDLEGQRDELYRNLANPTFYQNNSSEIATVRDRLSGLETELEIAYQRWEELESISN